MKNSVFDITRINSFATLLMVAFLIFLFSVSGYESSLSLDAYTPFQSLIDGLVVQNKLVATGFICLFVLVGAVLLGRLGVQHSIYPIRCYLGAIFFVVLSMSMGSSPLMARAYLSALILIFAVRQIFRSRTVKRVVGYRWFACGFWLALSVVIFSESIVAIFLIIIAMMMFRMNSPREYVAAFGGVLMVSVMSASIYVLLGVDLISMWRGYVDFISIPTIPQFSILEWIFVGLTFLIFVLDLITVIRISIGGRGDLVQGVLFFIISLVVCSILGLFTPLSSISAMPVTAIGLSMVLPSYFAGTKRNLTIKNLLFFMYILSAISLQYLVL